MSDGAAGFSIEHDGKVAYDTSMDWCLRVDLLVIGGAGWIWAERVAS